MVTISSLGPCQSYWVVVTAVDCINRINSSPQLIGLYDSVQFKFAISVENAAPCTVWIADNFARKIADIQSTISKELEESECGMSVPCVADNQFTCQDDPQIINYE